MRTLKELLIVLRDNAIIEPYSVHKCATRLGLCYQITDLRLAAKINRNECELLKSFITAETERKHSVYYPYMYMPGNWTYRKRWLNKQIKLLDEQDNSTTKVS